MIDATEARKPKLGRGVCLALYDGDRLTFSGYAEAAESFDTYPTDITGVAAKALGLTGEAGEVAEKIKKIIRDQGGELSKHDREQLKYEIGDVLWYAARLANAVGIDFYEVAVANIDKLCSRKIRGVIGGSGDNR